MTRSTVCYNNTSDGFLSLFDKKELQGQNINKLVWAYLFDNSSRYVQIYHLLNEAAKNLEISSIHFNDVTIGKNSILEIDRNINLMNINHLCIRKGGSLKILAKAFKVDAVLIDVSN